MQNQRLESNFYPSLELAFKFATVVVGALYGLGMLIANSYLLTLGFADFELFRARYVFMGGAFVAPIVLTFLTVLFAMSATSPGYIYEKRFRLSLAIGTLAPTLFVVFRFAEGTFRPFMVTLFFVVTFVFIGIEIPYLAARSAIIQRFTRDWPDPEETLPRVLFLVMGGLLPLVIYFFVWVDWALVEIPEQYGGAEPKIGVFLVREDKIEDARNVGLRAEPGNPMTQQIQVIWEGADYVIFAHVWDVGVYNFKVSDDIFLGWLAVEGITSFPPPGTPSPATPITQ